MIAFIQRLFGQNDIAVGGFFLMLFGSIGAYLYRLMPILFSYLKRKCVVTIDIQNKDRIYEWLLFYIAKKKCNNKFRLLSASTLFIRNNFIDTQISEKNNYRLIFSPAPGKHVFWYKKTIVILSRSREKIGGQESGFFQLYEEVQLIFISRNAQIAKDMLQEVKDYYYANIDSVVPIYTNRQYPEWERSRDIKHRGLDTVLLKDSLEKSILQRIKIFFSKEDWYAKIGIRYKQIYLLHGPPGTGKTSVVQAMASELKSPLFNLALSDSLSDADLSVLMAGIPAGSILLIEDIDRILFDENNSKKWTLSGLLNMLDGVISPYGVIIFITTNNLEKLPDVITRPGRVDEIYKLTYADKDQAAKMFMKFFDNVDAAATFSDIINDKDITMADIQQYLYCHRDSMDSAIKNRNNIKKEAV